MSEPRRVGVSELFAFEAGVTEGRQEVVVILTDLIAELRDRHTPRDGLCNYCWSCDRCPVPWPCPDSLAADRAEARLREVQGE